ncbi:hypothetical protein LC087_11325 [Bacillus carboniphilus]|uniref:Flagellar protein FliT n=1 Tax=Bacillus carboniphilus TaxID=86663 RepID=A0ABY9JQ10_9BACI|nr:hypothetical protein [Bacillus carboniphilus]WLR41485.1 hypothetical protein LC087_11325 [Bacillus carboniphilus]
MSESVSKLYEITKRLLVATKDITPKNRSEKMIEVENLLLERENVFPQLKENFTREEKKLGREIIKMNDELQIKIEKMKVMVQKDLLSVKKTQAYSKNYRNPYNQKTVDGVFYDKRQ